MADAVVTFGAAATFGALSGWEEQSSTSNVVKDRVAVLNELGNEAADNSINERTEVSTTYRAGATGATTILPAAIGDLLNGYIVTGISVRTSADGFVEMTLTGHNHTSNAHAVSPALRKGTHSIALTGGFGATDFLGSTAGSNATIVSSSCEITCEHTDEIAGDGTHFVGQNHNGKIVVTTEWVGTPSAVGATGYDVIGTDTGTDNQGFQRTTYRAEKGLAVT